VIAENYYLLESVFWLMFLVGSCGAKLSSG